MTELSTLMTEAYDADSEEGTKDTIPPGKYTAEIVDAKCGPLKSGKGQAVNLRWSVLDEGHSGFKLFQMCIVAHESADAMKFGRQKLKDICTAVGHTGHLSDLSVLHNKPCQVQVKIDDRDANFPAENVIAKVKPLILAGTPVNGAAKIAHPEMNDDIPF